MSILHRYILSQLIPVFLLALAAFTSIFVLAGLVQQATQQGLSPIQVLCMIPFVVPAALPYAIPATLLLSVTIVYGRMAADNEITATKAAGINVLHLVLPALALGVGLSLLTMYLNDGLIPHANRRLRTLLVNNVEDMVYAVLRRDHVLKASGMAYEIHTQRVEGKKLINATFKRRTPEGTYDLTVFAQEAALEFDLTNRSVKVHVHKAVVTNGDAYVDVADEKTFGIDLPNVGQITPGIRDLTLRDIESRKTELVQIHEAACGQWVFKAAAPLASGNFDQVQWGGLVGLSMRGRDAQRDLWRLGVEPHLRAAIAFGCLAFVLLGCPVAILFRRGDYLSAFISCFLPIILLYYPILMFGFNMSKEGIAPPVVVWGGNLFLAAIALLAFRPVLRH